MNVRTPVLHLHRVLRLLSVGLPGKVPRGTLLLHSQSLLRCALLSCHCRFLLPLCAPDAVAGRKARRIHREPSSVTSAALRNRPPRFGTCRMQRVFALLQSRAWPVGRDGHTNLGCECRIDESANASKCLIWKGCCRPVSVVLR
jgi:hypothetical protein